MREGERKVFGDTTHRALRVVYHEPAEGHDGFYKFGIGRNDSYAGTVDKAALRPLIEALTAEVNRE